MLKEIKTRVENDPEFFKEAPLLVIAMNFMTFGGILVHQGQLEYGFILMAFSAVLVVLEKYVVKNKK